MTPPMPGTSLFGAALLDDNSSYSSRFDADVDRLFSDQVRVDAFWRLTADTQVHSETLSDLASLTQFINAPPPPDAETIWILNQRNSYGGLQIPPAIFQGLMSLCRIFPPFLKFIHAFGHRQAASDDYFTTYHCRYSSDDSCNNPQARSLNAYEFCYNLRYPANNGRKTKGSPWSMRHMAIYEHYSGVPTGHSQWVLVQPPDSFKARVTEYLTSAMAANLSLGSSRSTCAPTVLHCMFLAAAESCWRDYLNYLQAELTAMEEKALFSRVGRTFEEDYNVAFDDSQELQRLRKKLLKARTIIDSSVDIGTAYKEHCLKLRASYNLDIMDFMLVELDIITAQFRSHMRHVSTLLELSGGVAVLLSQILQFRNEETLLSTNKQIQTASDNMQRGNEFIRVNTEALAALALGSQKETQAMKVLTIIAILYLPASLVAGVFSSNLIQTAEGSRNFVLAKQFWIYPVATVALMGLTLMPLLIWRNLSIWGGARNKAAHDWKDVV